MLNSRVLPALAGVLSAALLAACVAPPVAPPDPAAGTHVVVDATGAEVVVPTTVTRIADAWPAHNEVVQMLGAGDKIVATVLTPPAAPWLYRVQPALEQAETVFTNDTVSTEALTQTRPDVLFTDRGSQIAAKTTELGIPTVALGFQTFDDLKKMVSTTADVLGPEPGSPAQVQAQAYNTYLDERLAHVTARTATVPGDQRPGVLHVYSLDPLVVDGTGSIIDAWITAAGGRNVAEVEGNVRPVSVEQVAQWNPDVIILASSAFVGNDTGTQTLASLTGDPFWSALPAVVNGRAYINPTGSWHWDRYGIEEALQIQWASQLLHPDLFADLDMVAETRDFYRRFLHHELSAADAARMLAGEDPA